MANVKFLTGTETNLLKKNSDGSYINPIVEGSLYVTAEKVSGVWVSNLYYDINGQRIKVADTSGKAMYDHMNNNIAQTYIKKITMEGTKYASTDGATLTYTTGDNVETTILLPLASTTKAGTVNTGAQTFAGNKTFMGQVILQGGTDTAAGTANSGALIIGSPTGAHISVDANEIQAKSSGTASAQLHINNDGGITQFGGIVQPKADNTLTLGTEKLRWKTIYGVTVNATTFNGALNGNVKGNLDGNAATADKWYTARTITLGEDMQGTVSIDGSKNVTLNAISYSTSCLSGNKANYPWHRIATTGAVTGSHNDKEMIIAIRHSYDGGGYGVAKISLRTNNVSTGGTANASIRWLYRYNIAKDALKIGLRNTSGNALADLYYKVDAWARCRIYQLQGSRSWTLIASNEVDNTTTTDKLTSKEVYTSVSNGNTLLGAGYTSTVEASDGATVQNANYASTADGAKTDSANNTITTHYLSKIGFDGTTNKATKVVVNLYNGSGAIKATVDFPTASASQAGAITTGTQTLTGAKTLDVNGSLTIQKNSGFNYSGIGTASDAVARHVWFSHSSNKGMPILSDKFKYNPASTDKWATVVANATDKTGAAYGKLIVDVLEGIAARAYADDRGQQISKKYVASLSFNGTTNKATKVTMTYNDGTGAEIATVNFPTASASSAGAITTGTQTLTGAKTFDTNGSLTIQKTSGFNYSGIENASSDSARHVWFSHASNVGTPVKNDKFKLNPGATDTWATVVANATDKTGSAYSKLIVNVVEGIAARAYADDRGQKISTKYVATMAFSGTGSTVTLTYRDGAGADIGTTNIPVASSSAAGIITNAAQSIGGDKTFHGMIKFPNVTTGETKGIQWTMADNDSAKIIAGSTASDSGYLEIQTNDNGNEPIYVRQYSAGTLKRTLTLLNGSGNTIVPGNILPVTHASADTTGQTIGSSSALWKEIYARIFYAYSKFTTPSGLFYANNDGDMYVANNTGLGVAPDSNYALKVTGNTFNNGIVYFGNGTTNYVNNSANARFNTVGINGANTTYRLYVNGNTLNNGIVYFANGTTYYINNSADSRLRYVGVGSLAPNSSYALRIGGNVYLNGIHYFANGTTYYVNNSGVAHFKQLLVNGGNAAYNFSVSGTGYFASDLTVDGDIITKSNFKNPNGVVSFVQNNTIVTATTDWNTLTTPGCYKVQMSAWGDAATYHSPNSAQSSLYSYGLLFVIKGSTSDSENRTLQIYFPHQTSTAQPNYCRMLNGTGWQAWHKFHRGALDLTGGTMTGTINAQHIYPKTDNTYNNGSSTKRWKEIHGYTIYAHTKFQNPAGSFYADSNGRMYVQNGTGLGVAPSTDGTYILKVTGNSLFNGILYFANATKYYINNSGTANLNSLTTNNTTHFKKGIRIGDSATGDTNYICFYGTTGDGPGNFNHTYIGENQWDTTIEASELLLFKGNDMASGTSMTTAVAPGPDRIRMVAAGHLFQTYETAVSGSWTTICDSTVPKTRFEIFRDGTRTHGTAYFASGSTYYINNSGHTFLPIVSIGGGTNIGYNLYVQGSTLHNGIVYFANAQNYYINNSADTRLRYAVIGGTSLSPSSTYPLQVIGHAAVTGDIRMRTSGTAIYWDGETYRQRILNTDDDVAHTNVFSFQQSANTGNTWVDLLRIQDDGVTIVTDNTGQFRKTYSAASTVPTLLVGSTNQDATIWRVYSSDSAYKATSVFGYSLKYRGTGGGNNNFLTLYADNQTATAQNIAYTVNQTGEIGIRTDAVVGYALYVNGKVKIAQGEDATSATTGALQVTGGISVQGASWFKSTVTSEGPLYIGSATAANAILYLNKKIALKGIDTWLRINDTGAFKSGTYFGSTLVRTDGQFQVGSGGSKFYANSSGNGYFSNTLGIAGTNTSYKLYVNGTSWFNNTVYFSSANYYVNGSGNARFNTVGINGANTGYRLYVNGTSYFTNYLQTTSYFKSTVATGTAPIQVTSTTMNPNLNADYVDGWHKQDILGTYYVTSGTANLSHYWCKIWDAKVVTNQYNDIGITIYAQNQYDNQYGMFTWKIRQNGTNNGGAYGYSVALVEHFGNITNTNIRLYYNNTTGACSVWVNCYGRYGCWNISVLKKCWRTQEDSTKIGTFYSNNFTTAQTMPTSSYISASYAPFLGNASTATALTTSAGNAGQPVYFGSGKPVAIDWHIGNSGVGEHNANNVNYNFCGYYTSNGPATSLGATTNDGALYAQAYNASWVGQIAQDYRNGGLYVRGKNNGAWKAWYRVLDTRNYTAILDGRYVNVSGDTMSSSSAQIKRAGSSVSWYQGRSNAFIRISSYSGYNAIYSMKTTNGDWSCGVYANNILYWSYTTDKNFNAGTNTVTQMYLTSAGYLYAPRIYKAVWNDYAEFRQAKTEEPGRVVIEGKFGVMELSTKRLQPGGNIISDTYGDAMGQTEKCKTPIAVAGRVLAYTYEDKETYELGDAVCTGPDGTVSKMTREEIREWPDRIIGTVSEIPTYETWGQENIKVNGRIWIKVK